MKTVEEIVEAMVKLKAAKKGMELGQEFICNLIDQEEVGTGEIIGILTAIMAQLHCNQTPKDANKAILAATELSLVFHNQADESGHIKYGDKK